MPAEGIHLTSFREASVSAQLSANARQALLRRHEAGCFGAVLVDFPYFEGYWGEALRYATGRPPAEKKLGAELHERAAVPLAKYLLSAAREMRNETLAAIGLGVVSHASIDRALHPLVNALARRFSDGRSHDAMHREVEKYQSVLFHEGYFGTDRMGTAPLARMLAVPGVELLDDPQIGPALGEAFGRALDSHDTSAAKARKRLRAMARSYAWHAKLLSSPIGARLVPPAEKERARPRVLEGSWGTFEAHLAKAIEGSVAVLDAAWSWFTATDSDAEAAARAFGERLAEGTIDPSGEEVDLDAPFVIVDP